jgi:Putative Ig domain/Calx-beta domain
MNLLIPSKTVRINFFVAFGIGLLLLAGQLQRLNAAEFTLEQVDDYILEGDPTSEAVVNVKGVNLLGPVTVSFTLKHISTSAKDVRLTASSVSLSPDLPTAVIPIQILDDYLVESYEDFEINLNPIRGHQVDTTPMQLTIFDSDELPQVRDLNDNIKELGTELKLKASANGEGVLSYQWRKNRNPIAGETADMLLLRELQLSDAGEYDVVVTGLTGQRTSNTSALIVFDGSTRWIEGAVGGSVSMTLPLSAPAGTTFLWRKGSDELVDDVGSLPRIEGASSRSLAVRRLTLEDAGYYEFNIVSPNGKSRYEGQAQFILHFGEKAPILYEVKFNEGYVGNRYFHQLDLDDHDGGRGTFTALGVPAGLVLDPATGTISGIPEESVIDRVVTITVTNKAGRDSRQALLTILPLPSSMVGTLQGWVKPETDAKPDPKWAPVKNGARFEIQTTTSGLFSGRISAGNSFSFSGRWGVVGNSEDKLEYYARVTVPVPDGWPLELFIIQVEGEEKIRGWLNPVGSDESLFDVQAWRGVSGPAAFPKGFVGLWNMHFELSEATAELYGTGFATAVVSKTGVATISARLPDGQAVTSGSLLGVEGQMLLYQRLYADRGCAGTVVKLVGGQFPVKNFVVGSAEDSVWIRPEKVTATDKFYSGGFSQVFTVAGGLYRPVPAGGVFLNFREVALNSTINLLADNLNSDTVFTMTPAGRAIMPKQPDNPNHVSLSFNSATGYFSGRMQVSEPDPSRPPLFDDNGNEIRAEGQLIRSASFQGLAAQIDPSSPFLSGGGYFIIRQALDPSAEPPITLANAQLMSGAVKIAPRADAQSEMIVSLSDVSKTITEGDESSQIVQVNLSGAFSKRRVIGVSIIHGDTVTGDARLSQKSVLFEPEETYAQFSIDVFDDDEDENDEVFYIELAEGLGYDRGVGQLKVVIQDDDTKPRLNIQSNAILVKAFDSFRMDANCSGDEPLSIQWFKDGKEILGAVGQTFEMGISGLSDGGLYQVAAWNRSGKVMSEPIRVTVVNSEKTYFYKSEEDLMLKVEYAPKDTPLQFQWFDGESLPLSENGGPSAKYSGVKSSSLLIRSYSAGTGTSKYFCDVLPMGGQDPLKCQFNLEASVYPPELEDLVLPDGEVGSYYEYQVLLTSGGLIQSAASIFSAAGLPQGLVMDSDTGLISGIPLQPVSSQQVIITAQNRLGSDQKTATILIEPFPASMVGTYIGWFGRDDGAAFGQLPGMPGLGGRVDLTVTLTGECSGKLTGPLKTYNFAGRINGEKDAAEGGACKLIVPGKNGINLHVVLSFSDAGLSGTLQNSGQAVFCPIEGWRQTWTAKSKATAYQGTYNFKLENSSADAHGYARMTVPAFGNFNISGRLPDGTVFLCPTFLGPNGQVLFYQKLYTEPGSFLGQCSIQLSADSPPVIEKTYSELSAYKPPQRSNSERLLKEGFYYDLDSVGGLYTRPSPGRNVFNSADKENNAAFSATGISQTFRLRANGVGSLAPGEDQSQRFTLKVNPATGEFLGGYDLINPDPLFSDRIFRRKVNYYGLITNDGAVGMCIFPELHDPFAEPPTTPTNSPINASGISLSPTGY